MEKRAAAIAFAALLLVPASALAQSGERLIVPLDLGVHKRGDYVFFSGDILLPVEGAFVIIQVLNPRGELCQIQQHVPLADGSFVSDAIPLRGALCSAAGEYEIRTFYGDHSATSRFAVSAESAALLGPEDLFDAAKAAATARMELLNSTGVVPPGKFESLEAIEYERGGIDRIEEFYTAALDSYWGIDALSGIDTEFKRSVESALDSVADAADELGLPDDIAADIRSDVYAAMLYYEAGDSGTAVARLNGVYDAIRTTTDPIRPAVPSPRSFEEVRASLLALMTKTGSLLSDDLIDEIGHVFARGTGPIYDDEVRSLQDTLTKARYIEISSRRDGSLYTFVWLAWEDVRSQIRGIESLDGVYSVASDVARVYDAARLIRDLDDADDYVSDDDADSELAPLLRPAWEELAGRLSLASDVDDILDERHEIQKIKSVLEISSRLDGVLAITRANGLDTELTAQWSSLLDDVRSAETLDEVLAVVGEFDRTITSLQERRSPIPDLEREFRSLKARAELQADHAALADINNALRILQTAGDLASGNPTRSKIDRVEVLLAWAVQLAPQIDEKLSSYSKDIEREKKADILQRAQSLENLSESGLRTKRFVPGYEDFVDSIRDKIAHVRDLATRGDLKAADDLMRSATSEWHIVTQAFLTDPPREGESIRLIDVQRRIYADRLTEIDDVISNFVHNDFAAHYAEYNAMRQRVDDLMRHGNVSDADAEIERISEFLNRHLALSNESIRYDISYDYASLKWLISGFVEKDRFDRRDDVEVTLFRSDTSVHSELEFIATKHGRFHVSWDAPPEPGIYVAKLARTTNGANDVATQIVYVPYDDGGEKEDRERRDHSGGPVFIELSRIVSDLKAFIQRFGGEGYRSNSPLFNVVLGGAEDAIFDRNEAEARAKVAELRALIERHLPARERSAVIEASYSDGTLRLEGAVEKTILFREDIFVDVYFQDGSGITSIALKDDSAGFFDQTVRLNLEPGTYVATLSYHDTTVSDFFSLSHGLTPEPPRLPLS